MRLYIAANEQGTIWVVDGTGQSYYEAINKKAFTLLHAEYIAVLRAMQCGHLVREITSSSEPLINQLNKVIDPQDKPSKLYADMIWKRTGTRMTFSWTPEENNPAFRRLNDKSKDSAITGNL